MLPPSRLLLSSTTAFDQSAQEKSLTLFDKINNDLPVKLIMIFLHMKIKYLRKTTALQTVTKQGVSVSYQSCSNTFWCLFLRLNLPILIGMSFCATVRKQNLFGSFLSVLSWLSGWVQSPNGTIQKTEKKKLNNITPPQHDS